MKEIKPEEVKELVDQDADVTVIDVREADEVAEGHIPGAKNIPLGLLEFRENELDKNEDYIMVCRSGGRSGKATQYLEERGYKVKNMTGGMLAWDGSTQ
ncbi:rhodanese-like domain-containing protein [Alkalibacillus salilacus]|uniref:Rhodanese-related sulfurtransferase n=1 Tax=Alkalibacillus salilacus TaxID=284582 RepID=A0ABT9VBQ1_9BACI|nr:rhodanese-like domain-containing protein [Alkalibacillus salilacus]MDQ0158407.1 rhodanese-related sulfurtransferase [Alkalibacillus salilacus]